MSELFRSELSSGYYFTGLFTLAVLISTLAIINSNVDDNSKLPFEKHLLKHDLFIFASVVWRTASTMELWEVNFQNVLEETKQIIRQCFEQYQLNEIFLSFNGGKDCTVLLDITLDIIKEIYGENQTQNLRTIYIRSQNPFPELEAFIRQARENYGLNLSVVEGGMKQALQVVLDEDGLLKACLMGTRNTDPYSSHLKFMQKTDQDWPQIMRVSPLLNWTYHQIWSYLLKNKVPYCSLYDKGYTSIGSTLNTIPNPSLQCKALDGALRYNPAYQLLDETLERNGRITNNTIANGHNKL